MSARAQTTAARVASRQVCFGCGAVVEAPGALTCPRHGHGDVDHVLRRVLDAGDLSPADARAIFLDSEPSPFLRYRELLHLHAAALRLGFDDDFVRASTDRLDARVAEVDGRGFRETPFDAQPSLAERLGVADVRVKNETGNVSGSHKARHLMAVALWMEAMERAGRGPFGDLAVASCGNAALAAAVVARAVERPLEVFVPPAADETVVTRLEELDARLHRCPRRSDEAGDPCYLRFREAIDHGAVPFSCQGSENALVADGGKTLAWEMVSAWLRQTEGPARSPDRLFVQVGGGALAASLFEGLVEAQQLGVLKRLPRLHAVQSEGAFPLVRAWDRLTDWILERLGEAGPGTRAETADRLRSESPPELIDEALHFAAVNRSRFMIPWQSEPTSVAYGILDDETYDWLAVVEGMLRTGGHPVIARESTLVEAHELGRRATGIPVCATGTAGLAGAMELSAADELAPRDSVVLLFTGIDRNARGKDR